VSGGPAVSHPAQRRLAQRFTGTLSKDGATIVGQGEMSRHRGPWEDDLAITYTRLG
jgi:hypothetical protein